MQWKLRSIAARADSAGSAAEKRLQRCNDCRSVTIDGKGLLPRGMTGGDGDRGFGEAEGFGEKRNERRIGLPSSGTALTRTARTKLPSSRAKTPSRPSRPALGVTRRESVTPVGVSL
jgi:hypothetical protein